MGALFPVLYNAAMGVVTTIIIGALKKKFPVISGTITTFLSSVFGVFFVFLGSMAFGLTVLQDATTGMQFLTGLGITQTVATISYELGLFKKKVVIPPA